MHTSVTHSLYLSLVIPYLPDQTPLSISRHSRIVAEPPDMQSEIVAILEYYPRLIFE